MDTAQSTLVIKTPSDEVPSHMVHYESSWSVKELKEHLCVNYPTHPPPHAQRLIYAGKLLSDETPLSTLFKTSASGRTIHLVCRNVQSNTQAPKKPAAMTMSASDFIDTISPTELQQYQKEYYEYLRGFYTKQMENFPLPAADGGAAASADASGSVPWSYPYPYYLGSPAWSFTPSHGISGLSPYYSGVHSSDGHAHPAAQADNGPAAFNPHLTDNVAHPDLSRHRGGAAAVVAEREPAVNGPAVAAPQQQQQQQAVLMGNPLAAGLMGEDEMGENGGNLDIIDRFYMLFRLTLFIGLCFAYSSLDKAIIVFSAAAYIYFYNIYRRHAAARPAAIPAPEPPGPPPANVPSSDQTDIQSNSESTVTERTRRGPEGSTDQLSQPTTTAPIQPGGPESRLTRVLSGVRSVLSISFQFFSSLITSLIPEQPPPIRLD